MASPQRPEFHERPEFHGISGRDDPETKGLRPGHPPASRRATYLFSWLIGVILIGAFFYWIAWGWQGTGGYWWAHQTTPARATNGGPIEGTGLDALNAANKQPYIDQNFRVSNVPIQKKVTDQIYWIGPKGHQPMLVVVSGNADSANLKQLTPGTLATVAGTIDKAPPAAQAESQWPLSNPGLAQLEKEGAYVRATEMIWAPK